MPYPSISAPRRVPAIRRRNVAPRLMLACWAAAAVLFAAGGAAAQTCTDPVDIPDDKLKAKLWSALGGTGMPGAITCAQMASLTRLDAQASSGNAPHSERIRSLEGLQFATALNHLQLQDNLISDLSPLSALTGLRRLFIHNNRISDVRPLRGLTSLRELQLDTNWISDLGPLQGLTSLVQLFLTNNRIQDLGPLRGMTGLQILEARNNRISDLSPLQGLTSLARLNLEANRIQDIAPLAANMGLGGSGDRIYLRGNPLDAAAAGHVATIGARGAGGPPCWDGCVLWDSVLTRVQGLKVVPQGTVLRASWELLSGFAPTGHTLLWRRGDAPWAALPFGHEERFSSNPDNGRVARVGAVTSHAVPGLTPGVLYSFMIRAEKNGTRGEYSEEATARVLPKVKGVEVTPRGGSLAVAWTAAEADSGADGYRVEWKPEGGDWDDSREARVSGTGHTIDGLDADVEYTVRVRATQGEEGWGQPSDEAKGTPLAGDSMTGDLDPGELQLTPMSAALELRWGAWCAATTYLVQWRKSEGEDYDDSRQAEVTGTSHTIGGIDPGVEYTVRVTPRGVDGCDPAFAESPETAEAGFDTSSAAGIVDAAVNVQEDAGSAQLRVRRFDSSDAPVVILWRTEDILPGSAGPAVAAAGGGPAPSGGSWVPARAGEDYTAVANGRLTLARGQTAAMLTVEILDDDRRVEPLEAFRVHLLRSQGVRIVGMDTVIVEIEDDDTQPQRRLALQAVLAGAGGRIAAQALEAIEARPGAGEPQAVIAGQALVAPGERAAGETWDFSSRAVSAEELLTGSSFDLPLAGRGAEAGWRVWAQAAATGFDSRLRPDFRMDGEIVSGFAGVERRVGADALVGLALSRSEGDIDYTADEATKGAADVALTGLLPYVHWNPRPELGVWGAFGFGWGDLGVEDEAGAVDTGLEMRMAAAGLRRDLAHWRGVALAVKADAFLASLEADAARDLPRSRGDASRLRLRMEGSKAWQFSEDEQVELGLDFGGRRDGGDAENGLGLELGAGLDYADARAGLALGMDARYLLAHREKLEEWSAALTARLDPGAAGLGPWLALAPQWRQGQAGGLDLDLGWGLAAHGGLLTPYAGMSLGERERRGWKLGARAGLGGQAFLSLEGARRDQGQQATLSAGLRW